MFSYFFLVITSFWILKPIKKTMFLGHYATSGFEFFGNSFEAPEAEALAKVMNMVVAAFAVIVFSTLARRIRREQLTYVFTTFFLIAYGLFAFFDPSSSGVGVWSFYLFGDLFSTLMVATFFSFLNDSVSSDAAKRLYGVVGFGGVLGGVFGSSAVFEFAPDEASRNQHFATLYAVTNWTSMFVQRFAKAIGVGISLIVKKSFVGFAGVSTFSFVVLPIAALWAYAAIYAGRKFKELEESAEGATSGK